MITYSGSELHLVSGWRAGEYNRFVRMIVSDGMVLSRMGERGTDGEMDRNRWTDPNDARTFYYEQLGALTRVSSFTEVFDCHGEIAADEASLEEAFEAQWRLVARNCFGGPGECMSELCVARSSWELFDGLLAAQGRDVGVDAILAYVLEGPHAISVRDDRIVGRVARHPGAGTGLHLRRGWGNGIEGHHWRGILLQRVCYLHNTHRLALTTRSTTHPIECYLLTVRGPRSL